MGDTSPLYRELTEDEKEEAFSFFMKMAIEGLAYGMENYGSVDSFPEGHQLRVWATTTVDLYYEFKESYEELQALAERYGIESDPDY